MLLMNIYMTGLFPAFDVHLLTVIKIISPFELSDVCNNMDFTFLYINHVNTRFS